jgi:hypothetical protein
MAEHPSALTDTAPRHGQRAARAWPQRATVALGLSLLLSPMVWAQQQAASGATQPAATEPGRSERGPRPGKFNPRRAGPKGYSIEQALSSRAQLHTIAFSALAFLTGDLAADTFLPPGKVSDYFGFQYLRDTDQAQAGHRGDFLTRIAHAMLAILNTEQKAELVQLARAQQDEVDRFARLRWPLMLAFRAALEGRAVLSEAAVIAHSAQLYRLDGQIALARARTMARVLRSLDDEQKKALSALKFGDSSTWGDAPAPLERRGLPHDLDVALMTYASEMFAWASGSVQADVYFCPERHGMYFGGFGLKTAPLMGRPQQGISTTLTGDSGAALLAILGPEQSAPITALPAAQAPLLQEIVQWREVIAKELRRELRGERADDSHVLQASLRYGELDGRLSFQYAQAFAAVGAGLSPEQRSGLAALREVDLHAPKGPFLYAKPVPASVLSAHESAAAALFDNHAAPLKPRR